jgi:hypothetical protein
MKYFNSKLKNGLKIDIIAISEMESATPLVMVGA